MLIYCHPGKNQAVREKAPQSAFSAAYRGIHLAWFFPLLQIKHLRLDLTREHRAARLRQHSLSNPAFLPDCGRPSVACAEALN